MRPSGLICRQTRLCVLALFLAVTQIGAAQHNTTLIVSDFRQKDSMQVGYESQYLNLGKLIPERMQTLFRVVQYHVALSEDSVYVLRGKFSKNGDSVCTCWEVVNLRTGRVRRSVSVSFVIAKDEDDVKNTNSVRDLSRVIVDALREVQRADKATVLVLAGDCEVEGRDSKQLLWIAAVIKEFLRDALFQTADIIARDAYDGAVYTIEGSYWQDTQGLVNAECRVVSERTGNQALTVKRRFEPLDELCVADSLASMLFEDIMFNLGKATRIAIAEFYMSGGDSSYSFLSRAIPRMFESGLKGFRQLTIVEVDESRSLSEVVKTQTLEGRIDPRTHLELGRIMRPNYLILGEYWELDGYLGVEARCLNIETSETIISDGITLHSPDLETLKTRITELASKIRTTIIRDIMERRRKKIVAVIGLRPFPNSRDNRERTKHIIRAISRKLKIFDSENIRIKDDRAIIDSFIEHPMDVWNMAIKLDVDRLFAIQYEDHGEGWVTIDSDLFDIRDLRAPIFSHSEHGRVGDIQAMVDTIVTKALDSIGIEDHIRYSSKKIQDLGSIYVRSIARPHSITLSYGRVITDTDGPLEYKENSSFVFYASLPIPARSAWWSPRWKIVPMITWDWGDGTLENLFLGDVSSSVHLISLFGCAKYCILSPGDIFKTNVGLGIGFLWLRRIYGADYNFLRAPADIKPGVTLIADIEYNISPKFAIVFPLKFYTSICDFEETSHDGRSFNGGWLWGINVGLAGISYSW